MSEQEKLDLNDPKTQQMMMMCMNYLQANGMNMNNMNNMNMNNMNMNNMNTI